MLKRAGSLKGLPRQRKTHQTKIRSGARRGFTPPLRCALLRRETSQGIRADKKRAPKVQNRGSYKGRQKCRSRALASLTLCPIAR